jgi:hypothetical protein
MTPVSIIAIRTSGGNVEAEDADFTLDQDKRPIYRPIVDAAAASLGPPDPESTTRKSPLRHAHVGRVASAALFTAALALAASAFAHPAIGRADFDSNYYDWCLTNLKQGKNYCCQQAGGVLNSGGCMDPANIYVPAPPTISRNPGPPIIIVSPATATTP